MIDISAQTTELLQTAIFFVAVVFVVMVAAHNLVHLLTKSTWEG